MFTANPAPSNHPDAPSADHAPLIAFDTPTFWKDVAAVRTGLEALAEFPSRAVRKHVQAAVARLDAAVDALLKMRAGLSARTPTTDLLWVGQSLTNLQGHPAPLVRECAQAAFTRLSAVAASVSEATDPRAAAGASFALHQLHGASRGDEPTTRLAEVVARG